MDTMEKFYIYSETRNSNQINDKTTVRPNKIFDTVLQGETDRLRMHNKPNTNLLSAPYSTV